MSEAILKLIEEVGSSHNTLYRGDFLLTWEQSEEDLRRVLDGVEEGEIVSLHFRDGQGTERVVNVRMP